MSKSKGNGVSPDSMSSKYGVDTLRTALMFACPPESDVNFEEAQLQSMKLFIDKIAKIGEDMCKNDKVKEIRGVKKEEIQQKYKEKLIPFYELLAEYEHKINIQRFFHVAIARLMEYNNNRSKFIKSEELEL